MLVCLSFGVR